MSWRVPEGMVCSREAVLAGGGAATGVVAGAAGGRVTAARPARGDGPAGDAAGDGEADGDGLSGAADGGSVGSTGTASGRPTATGMGAGGRATGQGCATGSSPPNGSRPTAMVPAAAQRSQVRTCAPLPQRNT